MKTAHTVTRTYDITTHTDIGNGYYTMAPLNVFAGMRRELLCEENLEKEAVMSIQNQPDPWPS